MILIRFPSLDSERKALGRLAGRFSFKSWATGEMLVPESALPYLAVQGIAFTVEGPATYEQLAPALRDSLPLRFNDGQPVPDELVADTLIELKQRFGAVSHQTQVIRGLWQHEGQAFRDDLARVLVDVTDLPENREFFPEFKERMKNRFRQVDIWVTTYLIEVI
jgi:hypothetical protein